MATGSVINRLEKGLMGLTFDWAYRIAQALACDPSQLMERPPPMLSAEETAVVKIYRELAEEDRRSAFRVIDALAKSDMDIFSTPCYMDYECFT